MIVSIIIPLYNVEQYIEECLKSVTNQTFRGGLECIIVDDCGTDASLVIAERFVQDYVGHISFRIIHHECNRGFCAARNTGLDAATGDYVYFLDPDDWITPDCIDLLAECAMKHSGVDLVQGGVCNAPHKLKMSPDLREYYTDRKEIAHLFWSDGLIPVTAWNKLINNDFIIRNKKVRFKEGFLHEDLLFSYYLAQYSTSVAVLNSGTYHYREYRVGSITSRRESNYWLVQQLKECLKDLPSSNREIYLHFIFSKLLYLMSFSLADVDANDWKIIYHELITESDFLNKMLLRSLRFVPKRFLRTKLIYNTYIRMAF